MSTAAKDLMEWLGSAWAISFHHPCEGAGVNACGTVPDRGGYVAYIRTLSDGHPESDREWSLHITPPDAGEELPQIIVWSNAGDTVSCIGLGRKLNGEPYSASDCTLLLDTVTHIWSMLRHGRLASLVARSATRVRHLDDDLAMACDIQQRFLPCGCRQ